MSPRERIVRVLLYLIFNPYQCTSRDLSRKFGVSHDRIKDDLRALEGAGLPLDRPADRQYRIAILPDHSFRELTYLQPLSDADKARIKHALRTASTKEQLYLSKKLDSLYDFQQLGIRALRKPALERINQLEQARKNKQRVILKNYHSASSNDVRDRKVEPFHIDTSNDLLQAYDTDQKLSRHYRLSRIQRVEIVNSTWKYESDHRHGITDVFGIVDNQQVNVHLTVDVFAYNGLTEQFPSTKAYLVPGSAEHSWDFQALVNHQFKGLLPFILAHADHVDILSPAVLSDQIMASAKKIMEKLSSSEGGG
jgi:predicted DNA-binding transcriptional regulator YafY